MSLNLNRPDLAVNGGSPLRTKAWLDNYTTGDEEKVAALESMDTGYISLFEASFTPTHPFSFWGGPYVQRLEKEWCEYYNIPFAVSMNSATSGLYAALGALEIGYGDEVIVSPCTMTACAVGPLIYGAIPIFADVERETGCLDVKSIEKHITPRTRCIILIHQYGIPADMDAIMELARKNNIKVIEDCAQAHASTYKGKYVGTIGDIGVFSLNVNKTIQSGEGCVCVTSDEDLRYRLALIRNHGEAVVGPSEYDNILNIIGFNFRMSEIQSAIALEQLKKVDFLTKIRLEMVDYLNKNLKKYDFLEMVEGRKDCKNTYYQYPILFNEERSGISKSEFQEAINAEGLLFFNPPNILYQEPIYQRKLAFKHGYPFSAPENSEIKTNYHEGSCPIAEKLRNHELLLNEHVRFPNTLSDMEDIVKIFEKVIGF